MNSREKLYLKAAKLNLLIIFIASMSLAGQMIYSSGIEKAFTAAVIPSLILCTMAFIIVKYVKNNFIRSISLPMIVSIAFMAFTFINRGAAHTIVIMIATVVMSAAYFDLRIVVIYASYTHVFVILSYLFADFELLGEAKGLNAFILHMTGLVITSLVLICLVKWVGEILEKAIEDENKASELLEKNTENMAVIEGVSGVLAESVVNLDDKSKLVSEKSVNMSQGISEISNSINGQAINLLDISNNTKEVNYEIEKTYKLSNKLEKLAQDLNNITNTNQENINRLEVQMDIIDGVNTEIMNSVKDFTVDMSNLADITEVIRGIAKETNLLALNAEIEAARAGEHGKSFSVVASEVRKLALEVNRITNDIDNKIQDGLNKINSISDKASEGNNATKSGTEIVDLTSNAFERMIKEIYEINTSINEEYKLVENINTFIKDIYSSIEDANEKSEQCTAMAEKVVFMQDEQQKYIKEMMGNIEAVGEEVGNLNNLL